MQRLRDGLTERNRKTVESCFVGGSCAGANNRKANRVCACVRQGLYLSVPLMLCACKKMAEINSGLKINYTSPKKYAKQYKNAKHKMLNQK